MTTELQFLKHTLDVLIIGDPEMIAEHAKTVQLRITTITQEQDNGNILKEYQDRINNRLLNPNK